MDVEITDEYADLDQRITVRLLASAEGTMPCVPWEPVRYAERRLDEDTCETAEDALPELIAQDRGTGCVGNQAYFWECGGFNFDSVTTRVI